MPPDDYTGYLRPRDAAQRIAELHGRYSRLSEADQIRMRALFFAGLHKQDAALGKLIGSLKAAGRWEDTLFVVTGDVSSGRQFLFRDGLPFDEKLLTLPLYVHFPAGSYAGKRVEQPTELQDVLRTVMMALGLPAPKGLQGRDLASLAGGLDYDAQRVRVAFVNDTYSARWADYVLLGTVGERPKLCVLSVDPSCAFDRSDMRPIVTQALFRRVVQLAQQERVAEREPLSLDSESAAMLKVWGAY